MSPLSIYLLICCCLHLHLRCDAIGVLDSHRDQDPSRQHTQSVTRSSCGGRQCTDLSASNGRGAACFQGMCCLPGMHEQPHLRGRDYGLLRDHRWWSGCWSALAWVLRRAHTHDQHPHHRPGDIRKEIPCHSASVFDSSEFRWVRRILWRRRSSAGNRVHQGCWSHFAF